MREVQIQAVCRAVHAVHIVYCPAASGSRNESDGSYGSYGAYGANGRRLSKMRWRAVQNGFGVVCRPSRMALSQNSQSSQNSQTGLSKMCGGLSKMKKMFSLCLCASVVKRVCVQNMQNGLSKMCGGVSKMVLV